MNLTGCIPSQPDARDWTFAESRIAAARPLSSTDSCDYRDHDVHRVQIAGSCVGQSFAGAAALCMAIAGTPITFPSALAIYTGARLLTGAPLVDHGSHPRLAAKWCHERGLVAEERWPELAEQINAVPPLDVYQEGECATLEAYYRIPEGPGAADELKAALRRGYCPTIGMIVDQKYADIGSQIYDGPGGTVMGGHLQVVVGYSVILDAFIVRNTWGKGFGIDGYAWLAASYVDRLAWDMWVVTVAPEVR